jgi:3-deoxy-D-manno-octulosonic-acid transferase
MIILYNLVILLARFGLTLGSLFHPKAKAFVTGRKNLFKTLSKVFEKNTRRVFWIHCASLGEFEQGRPVIEALKQTDPDIFVLLTFFSPSGYELRKNYALADHVCYLPWDTAANASHFVQIVKPALVIFVKYEFWLHYSKVLKKNNIAFVSISSIFREDQLFFQSYGTLYRKILHNFSYFFVQNYESVKLLNGIGITQCERAGDTRFDRVHSIVQQGEEIDIAKRFKAGEKLMVVGSCWPEDLDALIPLINEQRMKFIIAPHEITESFLNNLENLLQVKSIRYSQVKDQALDDYQVLLIDNIGMLSRLYRYGEFAYVGGAFGKGLHNILEAACYGVPIFFGNKNYQKFQEAMDLINRGGAFEIADYPDLKSKYEMLNIPENFMLACEVTRQYVEENLGATEKILSYCKKLFEYMEKRIN